MPGVFLLLPLVVFLPAALYAQTPALDTVVVTASRVAQTTDETLASVTVITREDIERWQAPSVPDILRRQPGLQVHSAGGRGKSTSVFMRGTNSDHVLVLIDGIKVGSATLGTTALQDLPVEAIERIEIVRGPRSSLYGSEALGGVIQIFTRKGGGALRPYVSLGGGSYRTVEGAAGLSGGGDQGWFNLGVSGVDTQGFDACRGEAATAFAGCFADEPDRDGYTQLSGSLRAGYHVSDALSLEAFSLVTRSDNEFDGSFQNESADRQQIYGTVVRYAPLSLWQMTLSLGHSLDASKNFKDGVFSSRFETRRDTLSWQNDLEVGSATLLTLGADYLNDRISGSTEYARTSRDNLGLFAQYLGYWERVDLQVALRHDDNQQFGHENTGSVALGYALTDTLRAIGSYGTAFKAPSFNALYFPGYGNPDLKPESSRTLEAGLRGPLAGGQWSVSLYESRIDDLIAHDAARSLPANIHEAVIRGAELDWQGTLEAWQVYAGVSLLDPQNRAQPHRGNLLPRRAEHSLNMDVERAYGPYLLGASVLAQGRRFDDVANSRRLDAFATMDLRAEYRISPDLRLQLRLENLFDEDYETASFYNQPGRSAYLSLRYQPQ